MLVGRSSRKPKARDDQKCQDSSRQALMHLPLLGKVKLIDELSVLAIVIRGREASTKPVWRTRCRSIQAHHLQGKEAD